MRQDYTELQHAVYVTVDNLSITEPTPYTQLVARIAQSSLVQKAAKGLGQTETHRQIGEMLDQGLRDYEWPLIVKVTIGLRNQGLPSPGKFCTEAQAQDYSLMLLVYYAFRTIAPTKRAGMVRHGDLIGQLTMQPHITAVFNDRPSELRKRIERALNDLAQLGCIRYVRIFEPSTTRVIS